MHSLLRVLMLTQGTYAKIVFKGVTKVTQQIRKYKYLSVDGVHYAELCTGSHIKQLRMAYFSSTHVTEYK